MDDEKITAQARREEVLVSVNMASPHIYGEEVALMSTLRNLVERSGASKEERARAVEWLYKKYNDVLKPGTPTPNVD